jgi:hypothetical protein
MSARANTLPESANFLGRREVFNLAKNTRLTAPGRAPKSRLAAADCLLRSAAVLTSLSGLGWVGDRDLGKVIGSTRAKRECRLFCPRSLTSKSVMEGIRGRRLWSWPVFG